MRDSFIFILAEDQKLPLQNSLRGHSGNSSVSIVRFNQSGNVRGLVSDGKNISFSGHDSERLSLFLSDDQFLKVVVGQLGHLSQILENDSFFFFLQSSVSELAECSTYPFIPILFAFVSFGFGAKGYRSVDSLKKLL